MEALIELFQRKLAYINAGFTRSLMEEINWNARFIGIKGARGIGKTTLLLQYIKLHLSARLDEVLYVSLDAIWFNTNSLVDLVKDFEQKGGKYIFLDEVHKYSGWAQELKNIYDNYPELKIVFTGSSLLEILNERADLSRRAVIYNMQGLSFREYLGIETGIRFERITLTDLLAQHTDRAREVNEQIKPFQHFDNYLRHGYYPYYKEESDLYFMRLGEVLNMMLEIELPLLRQIDLAYAAKIKQLLTVIAESVPFMPNVSKLSEKIAINRSTLLSYLHYLDEIEYAEKGDFAVDNQYTFEIGGKDKTEKQVKGLDNAYIVSDDITHGFHHKIPLWLFGFLY
ncbi:AAA family ATPase [Sphingobacterium phlebotomi]|uniref:AAA family ATPase n=1 Tax=Sphingobacterium phlebotomi TaxID=2605433 RepID=A0A5D4HA17_9SPHI|nr:AAA family ATPase [Sphingobacterium phlebotomi]TYR36679.1 AAA family ATPase [Sphingobacterium phlebotomi]